MSAAPDLAVVMLGATGAVGSCVVAHLRQMLGVRRITSLGRRSAATLAGPNVGQHLVDVLDPNSYRSLLEGHRAAVCTFGVGQPSKVSREEFVKLDKDAVLAFAAECKQAGVRHFELLSSVGVSSRSRVFYLRTKGELCEALAGLNFERLSLFEPSMILIPTNRYGLGQWLTLKLWPMLKPVLIGGFRKYRGIAVEKLGAAMAVNLTTRGVGVEALRWDDFNRLSRPHP